MSALESAAMVLRHVTDRSMSALESVALLLRHLTDQSNWRKRINCLDDYPLRLNTFDEAPYFMKHNPYIRKGYRGYFNPGQCIQSCFRWTNETLNIWTHGAALAVFVYHIMELLSSEDNGIYLTGSQRLLAVFQLTCYSITMGTSVFYHIFSCVSSDTHRQCYMIDVIGIVIGGVANYWNGIFYLYECYPYWKTFYMASMAIVAILILASAVNTMRSRVFDPVLDKRRFIAISCWIAGGSLLPVQWLYMNDFAWTEHAAVFFPRFLGFYVYFASAYGVYMAYLPERLCPGSVDYVGHSHQWWHIFTAAGCYWWYQSAIIFAEFSNNNSICLK